MATYLLTWNPEVWPWEGVGEVVEAVRASGVYQCRWSAGNTMSIQPGDRVFMLRQGREPRGIMASGRATSSVERKPHYDEERRAEGKKANFVHFEIDTILDPEREELLPTTFLEIAVPDVYWRPIASGHRVPEEASRQIEQLWQAHLRRRGRGGPSVY